MPNHLIAQVNSVRDAELAGDTLRVTMKGFSQLNSYNPKDVLIEIGTKHQTFRDFSNFRPRENRNLNSCLHYPAFGRKANGVPFLASLFADSPYAGNATQIF